MAIEIGDPVTFVSIDVDEFKDKGSLDIKSIPTFGFYRNGIKKATIIGAQEKSVREKIHELFLR